MERLSLGDRMRKCLMYDMKLYFEYAYIYELVPEQQANKAEGRGFLCIPPLVMLHMLFVLNYHRLGDIVKARQSLRDLQTLGFSDDVTHVQDDLKDIYWQILGICQHTCGDYVGALTSFQCSLEELPYNHIRKATIIRILAILGSFCNITDKKL